MSATARRSHQLAMTEDVDIERFARSMSEWTGQQVQAERSVEWPTQVTFSADDGRRVRVSVQIIQHTVSWWALVAEAAQQMQRPEAS